MEDLLASILAEVTAIMRMDSKSRLSRYGHLLPENTSRTAANLRSEIIYKLQENHYRLSLPAVTTEALNAALDKRRERKCAREPHSPGSQYVRIWHGEKHVLVCRGNRCYEYKGQTYRSPSEVAKLITGSN